MKIKLDENLPESLLATRIAAVFREENSTAWARCFVLLTDHKLRVHTPSRRHASRRLVADS